MQLKKATEAWSKEVETSGSSCKAVVMAALDGSLCVCLTEKGIRLHCSIGGVINDQLTER